MRAARLLIPNDITPHLPKIGVGFTLTDNRLVKLGPSVFLTQAIDKPRREEGKAGEDSWDEGRLLAQSRALILTARSSSRC
ncbi:MAG: hypothetical protein AAGC99_23930, partial [Pseudomonadota bacterium]